jgi:hypothetical protein
LRRGQYRGRRAATIENADLSVTVLQGGGHIAAICDKASGVNPLWSPPWPTIDPSACGPDEAAAYGGGPDACLLAGIMGHNLCLDIFGPPSDEEARAGLTAHGEGSVADYELAVTGGALIARAQFPIAGFEFERRVTLRDRVVMIRETLKNLRSIARPIGWTQHVTLGPPFLERGATEFRSSANRSKVFESMFGASDYLKPGAEFEWPMAPRLDGGTADLRVFTGAERSSAYTAHLMDRNQSVAFFVAFAPAFRLAFGYVWKPADFPWMGIWEENHSRLQTPWNGKTLTRGMEFGVSPMPETRQAMIARANMFGAPCFRTVASGETVAVEYYAIVLHADRIPESLDWPA